MDIVVGDEHLRRGHEIYVAMDAREVPHVLALQVAAVAPTEASHSDVVLVGLVNKVGDVELGIGVGAL